MLSDIVNHVDLLLVVVIAIVLYKLLGSPLHALVVR